MGQSKEDARGGWECCFEMDALCSLPANPPSTSRLLSYPEKAPLQPPPAQTAFPVAGLERDPPFFLYTYIKRMHGCCSGRGREKAHWAKERGPSISTLPTLHGKADWPAARAQMAALSECQCIARRPKRESEGRHWRRGALLWH